jgi:hypothetical protein
VESRGTLHEISKLQGLDLLGKQFDLPILLMGGSNSTATIQSVGTLKAVRIDLSKLRL